MALYYSDSNKNLIKVAGNLGEQNVEHSEVIYDKDSSDSNINWGYTSGILSDTSVTGKDFSKYKRLRVSCCCKKSTISSDTFGRNVVFEIDLTHFNGFEYTATYRPAYYTGDDYSQSTIFIVTEDKTKMTFVCYDSAVKVTEDTYVYQIEGIY